MTGYSTAAAAARAGITYRQLDYWCRVAGIEPSLSSASPRGQTIEGPGSRRHWSDLDLDRLIVIARVHDLLGETPARLAGEMWRWLGRRKRWPDFVTVARVGPDWHLYPGHEPLTGAALVVSTVGTRTTAEGSLFEEGVQARLIEDVASVLT